MFVGCPTRTPPPGLAALRRSLLYMHAVATTPAQPLGARFVQLPPATAAFPECQAGRLVHYPFRGVLSVHCSLRAACSPGHLMTLYTRGLDCFGTSTGAPIATGWSEGCRVGISATERTRLSTAQWEKAVKLGRRWYSSRRDRPWREIVCGVKWMGGHQHFSKTCYVGGVPVCTRSDCGSLRAALFSDIDIVFYCVK